MKYAGTPGAGPAGMTCRKCRYLHRSSRSREKMTCSCQLVEIAVRETLWPGTAACEKFEGIWPGTAAREKTRKPMDGNEEGRDADTA